MSYVVLGVLTGRVVWVFGVIIKSLKELRNDDNELVRTQREVPQGPRNQERFNSKINFPSSRVLHTLIFILGNFYTPLPQVRDY